MRRVLLFPFFPIRIVVVFVLMGFKIKKLKKMVLNDVSVISVFEEILDEYEEAKYFGLALLFLLFHVPTGFVFYNAYKLLKKKLRKENKNA